MTSVSVSEHPVQRLARPAVVLLLIVACLLVDLRRAAAQGEDAAAARWEELRTALFAGRPVEDGASLLQLETPYRAEDAAVVPVKIRSLASPAAGSEIQSLSLIIDMNPVPLAAVFQFSGDPAWKEIATRIRVNAYTHVRAVAETRDGRLYGVANFVKAAGGCSAPALKDPEAAAAQLGRMKLVLPEHFAPGERITAQWRIKHPNHSGFQFDQIARQYIPAEYIKQIRIGYQGRPFLTVDSNISLSEDPSLRFDLVAAGGELSVQAEDSAGRVFDQRLPLGSQP